ALPRGGEEAFGGELLLQPLERREVVAEPETLDRERAEAELAAALPQLRAAVHVDALAVSELEPQPVELAPRHRDAEAGAVAGVLEREEDALPPLLAPELRHLSFDPHRREPLQPRRDAPVEGGHRVDLPVAVDRGLDPHGRSVVGARRAPQDGPGLR